MFNTKKANNLIKKIKSKEISLVYLSMAEVYQQTLLLNIAVSNAVDTFKCGDKDNAIDSLITIISDNERISTEILTVLVFMLLDIKEFYFSGLLNFFLYDYFSKGDTSGVAVLDLPSFNVAFDIAKNRFDIMETAYRMASQATNFIALINYRNSFGLEMPHDDLDTSLALDQIIDYYRAYKLIKIDRQKNKIIDSLNEPVLRKVYSHYCDESDLYSEYICKMVISINSILKHLSEFETNYLIKEIDQIREIYRKIFYCIFITLTGTRKKNLGAYFIDDYVANYLADINVSLENYFSLKQFHSLSNAISHLFDEPNNQIDSDSQKLLRRFKDENNRIQKGIVLSPLIIISCCNFSDDAIKKINDELLSVK